MQQKRPKTSPFSFPSMILLPIKVGLAETLEKGIVEISLIKKQRIQ